LSGGVRLLLIIRRFALKRVRGFVVLGALALAAANGAHAELPGANGVFADNSEIASGPETTSGLEIISAPDMTSGRDAIAPAAQSSLCSPVTHDSAEYVICSVDVAASHLRLFLNGESGKPYGHFNRVNDALAEKGERLAFAMNAGMYHETRASVGLYIENSETVTPLNNNDGPGNFHLKPNGVFWIWAEDGHQGAHIATAGKFLDGAALDVVQYATQSGPMLVIDGEIHPRFLLDSTSRKRRNGVGVREDGAVIFVLADTPVTFHQFATFFRGELKTPNALYLDGTISRLYAPGLGRNDPGAAMGPIVGVVVKDD